MTAFSGTGSRTGADAGCAHCAAVHAETLTACFRNFLGEKLEAPSFCTTDNNSGAKRAGRDSFGGALGEMPCAPHWLGLAVVWLAFPPESSRAGQPRGERLP